MECKSGAITWSAKGCTQMPLQHFMDNYTTIHVTWNRNINSQKWVLSSRPDTWFFHTLAWWCFQWTIRIYKQSGSKTSVHTTRLDPKESIETDYTSMTTHHNQLMLFCHKPPIHLYEGPFYVLERHHYYS